MFLMRCFSLEKNWSYFMLNVFFFAWKKLSVTWRRFCSFLHHLAHIGIALAEYSSCTFMYQLTQNFLNALSHPLLCQWAAVAFAGPCQAFCCFTHILKTNVKAISDLNSHVSLVKLWQSTIIFTEIFSQFCLSNTYIPKNDVFLSVKPSIAAGFCRGNLPISLLGIRLISAKVTGFAATVKPVVSIFSRECDVALTFSHFSTGSTLSELLQATNA